MRRPSSLGPRTTTLALSARNCSNASSNCCQGLRTEEVARVASKGSDRPPDQVGTTPRARSHDTHVSLSVSDLDRSPEFADLRRSIRRARVRRRGGHVAGRANRALPSATSAHQRRALRSSSFRPRPSRFRRRVHPRARRVLGTIDHRRYQALRREVVHQVRPLHRTALSRRHTDRTHALDQG